MRNVYLGSTAFALLMILYALSARASVISPAITNPANGHTYELLSTQTWSSSETEANTLGAHLATIRNADEQQWVFGVFGGFGGTQRLLWIGLNDIAQEGTFVWSDGEPVTYTNWDGGEPNNASSNEDFVAMYYPNYHNPGSWNDWSSRTTDPIGIVFNGVVEFVPEPMTLGFLLPAIAIITQRRRSALRNKRPVS